MYTLAGIPCYIRRRRPVIYSRRRLKTIAGKPAIYVAADASYTEQQRELLCVYGRWKARQPAAVTPLSITVAFPLKEADAIGCRGRTYTIDEKQRQRSLSTLTAASKSSSFSYELERRKSSAGTIVFAGESFNRA